MKPLASSHLCRKRNKTYLSNRFRVQWFVVIENWVLAGRRGSSDGRAVHFLQRFVSADVGEAAVAGSPSSFRAIGVEAAVLKGSPRSAVAGHAGRRQLQGGICKGVWRMNRTMAVAGPARPSSSNWQFRSLALPVRI